MNNWKVIPTIVLATVLIFGAGVFTGGFLVDCVKVSHPKKIARVETPATNKVASTAQTNSASQQTSKSSRAPEILSKEFLVRLDTELHLTRDQHEAVQKIISDGQGLMKKVMTDARLEIREVLTAEQQQQFDTLVKKQPKKSVAAPGASMPPNLHQVSFQERLQKIIVTSQTNVDVPMPLPPHRLPRYLHQTNLAPEELVLQAYERALHAQPYLLSSNPPPLAIVTNAP